MRYLGGAEKCGKVWKSADFLEVLHCVMIAFQDNGEIITFQENGEITLITHQLQLLGSRGLG